MARGISQLYLSLGEVNSDRSVPYLESTEHTCVVEAEIPRKIH